MTFLRHSGEVEVVHAYRASPRPAVAEVVVCLQALLSDYCTLGPGVW
jgi:hypothetical protein